MYQRDTLRRRSTLDAANAGPTRKPGRKQALLYSLREGPAGSTGFQVLAESAVRGTHCAQPVASLAKQILGGFRRLVRGYPLSCRTENGWPNGTALGAGPSAIRSVPPSGPKVGGKPSTYWRMAHVTSSPTSSNGEP